MKECPVCKAIAFDDAQVCYGCLHRFEPGEGAMSAGGNLSQGGDCASVAAGAAAAREIPLVAQGVASAPEPAEVRAPLDGVALPQARSAPASSSVPQAPAPTTQAVSLSVPASDIVLRIEVVGAALDVGAVGESSTDSRLSVEQACELLRRSGTYRRPATSCPAEEQRGASAGRKAKGGAPARERARHAARDERQAVVA